MNDAVNSNISEDIIEDSEPEEKIEIDEPLIEESEINKISSEKTESQPDDTVFSNLSKDKNKITIPLLTKKEPFDEFEIKDEPFETDDTDKVKDSAVRVEEKFHWKPALIESGIFLGIQHAFRMTQKKTRRELGGPFFRDWGRSVRSLHGWNDGNKFFTNYVAHPMQGSLTGRIFVNNSDRAKKQEFGNSSRYWESRFKAMAWSAVWSTQFEIGPVSEATLGNVGIQGDPRYNKMAWVDFVVTPVVGTAWLVAEDALDKYVMKNWLERKTTNKIIIKIFRVVFAPTASFANVLRGKMPWYRDDRLLLPSNAAFND